MKVLFKLTRKPSAERVEQVIQVIAKCDAKVMLKMENRVSYGDADLKAFLYMMKVNSVLSIEAIGKDESRVIDALTYFLKET